MDYAGVDVALLHTDQMLGRDTAYLAGCVDRYPDRIRAMAPVDEWRIPTDLDAVIAQLVDAITVEGLHAIKFIPEYAYRAGYSPWRDHAFSVFWDTAASLGVPVFFGLSTGAGDEREGYLAELRHLTRWMARYPNTRCSLTHGFPYRSFLDGQRVRFPTEIWEPFSDKNITLEVSFPVRLGDLFDFPYRELIPAFEEMVARVGADHLMWGTDMPFQNRFCTYRQSRQWIERYCEFLSPGEIADVMGGTAARVLAL
jgi:predicted TIM-barrel fold metal-dependent hydrolase